jgi:hypothetical protein
LRSEFWGTHGKDGRGGPLWQIKVLVREMPDFSQAQQIAHDGFATPVFVGAIGM